MAKGTACLNNQKQVRQRFLQALLRALVCSRQISRVTNHPWSPVLTMLQVIQAIASHVSQNLLMMATTWRLCTLKRSSEDNTHAVKGAESASSLRLVLQGEEAIHGTLAATWRLPFSNCPTCPSFNPAWRTLKTYPDNAVHTQTKTSCKMDMYKSMSIKQQLMMCYRMQDI